MAIVQLGPVVTGIKGSIGGTTFSANRAGTVAKQRLTGKRKMSISQAQAISFANQITYIWNQLPLANKELFNEYAIANTFTDRYGQTKQLTGFQWYKQLCQASGYFAGLGLTEPPAYSLPAALPAITFGFNGAVMLVEWAEPIDTGELYVDLYATPPTRGAAVTQRGLFRRLDIRSLDYSESFDIQSKYVDVFGDVFGTYDPAQRFNINVFAFPVSRTSYNNGTYQAATSQLTPP